MGLTKFVLKRPVTTVLAVLCLMVFGLSSVLSSKLELTPEMNVPMVMISAVYAGASPNDINDLVTKPIEDEVGTLSGIKNTQSASMENMSIVMLEYEYGTDMDKAYSDLKKKMDRIDLPDDVDTPTIFEFNINDMPSMTLAVNDPSQDNLYNYVTDTVAPEFEKISSVASVDVSGGQKGYISIRLIPEKMNQYHLTMNSIAQAVTSADFTYPAGSTGVGSQKLSVSTSVKFDTLESLKRIPIVLNGGKTIYLEDVADINSTQEEVSGIGRYNGNDTISLSINKQQKSGAVDVSKAVNRAIQTLLSENPELDITVVNDTSDQITGSLSSVVQSMVLAVIVSMIIIFLFFGDIKASLIVGTSIPVSILTSLIMMSAMGFSLNVITLGSLVLGVGMMVDNSIVVLESCFRSHTGQGFREYMEAAVKGTGAVVQSIIGGTVTTCVVFIPLALLKGMSGQMFKPLGFTIVFCMLASLISAMTIVPLCYRSFRPVEKEKSPASGFVTALQTGYRKVIASLLRKRKTVMLVSVALLIFSFFLAGKLGFELMPAIDQGTISITIETRPGLKVEKVDTLIQRVEKIVTSEPDLKSYMVTYGGSGLSLGGSSASLTAYLKDDRELSTDEVVNKWKRETNKMDGCNITVKSSSSTDMMMNSGDLQIILQSAQLDDLKAASDALTNELKQREDVIKVHSDLENAAPVIRFYVDPIKASAEGLSPAAVGGLLNSMLSGTEATTLDVNGENVSVMVEYPKDEYDTLDKVEGIMIPTASGGMVALTDIADVGYEDSPASISRKNKQYQVTITGSFTDMGEMSAKDQAKARQALVRKINSEVVSKYLNSSVTVAKNSVDESMIEEFTSLFQAIAIAVFLVFVVMAAQFESPKFSLMVMTTIPFSLIGSFGLLYLANAKISMPSLLGFLILVGTVVNAGILYVDTVNQYRATMDKKTAIIEAGATRLRPILMTTLTTIVAMLPMAVGYGESGEMMQGLALVDVGGLTASMVLSLLMLPVYYSIMSGKLDKDPVLDD